MNNAHKREIKFIHPGIILNKEILKGKKISQKKLALEIDIPYEIVRNICQGKRDIDKHVGQKLSDYFQVSKDFWTNLQTHYSSVNQKKFPELVEAKEIEKDKSYQITLRLGYKELKKMFPSRWKEIKANSSLLK
ncbi:MAG: HigA family addiction module antidote protein [Candidatus Moeniiplasma glomeromycotorum]|nr:HigA family addiction module antidote protein [Candidatus Moeniiplasma glomeromycotorum]MCE8169541.1 HigA family addiction module antidote protein [Candidatus Moeniiplasma glomeromycotorum]